MTKGDMIFGKKTTYKGIEMRSILESKIALFFDNHGIKWEYEPKRFMLSNGVKYLPDFFLPELNLWIEVKGKIEEHNKEISKLFGKENKVDIILLSERECIYFGFNPNSPINPSYDEGVYIGKCSHCKSYFFCPNLGDYACRKCKCHEGDHDLEDWLDKEVSSFLNDDFKKSVKDERH